MLAIQKIEKRIDKITRSRKMCFYPRNIVISREGKLNSVLYVSSSFSND